MLLEALAALLLSPAAADPAPLPPSPLPPTYPACLAAWKDEYAQAPGVAVKDWDEYCAQGLTAEQILAGPPKEAVIGAPIILPPAPAEAPPPALAGAQNSVKTLDLSVHAALAGGDVAQVYGEKTAVPQETPVGGGVYAVPKHPGAQAAAGDGLLLPSSDLKTPVPDLARPDGCGSQFSSAPGWYQTVAGVVCSPYMPYRRAALGYLEMTGLQNYGSEHVGASNAGLDKFYGELTEKDPAFAAQVVRFYERVKEFDQAHPTKRAGKATLDRAAGTGRDARIEPGWAWKEALDVAKGDPDLAMRLIGFCGHDDVMRSKIRRPRTQEQARTAMEEKRKELTKEIADLKRRMAAKGGTPEAALPAGSGPMSIDALGGDSLEALKIELEYQQSRLASLRIENFRVEEISPCPQTYNSQFYLPRSLDRDADIPDKLKKKIADEQWAGHAEKSPAKYYHVYGAAAGACEMIRNGAPAWGAQMVQSEAAWMYRSLRMKTSAEGFARRREEMKKAYAAYLHALPPGQKALDEYAFRESLNAQSRTDPKKQAVALEYMDAYELMEDWGYFGRPFPYIGMPVVPLDHSKNWIQGSLTKPKPDGWSDARFAAAKKRMKTFFVDTEWTVAEHEAGARFAAKVCKEETPPAAAAPAPKAP